MVKLTEIYQGSIEYDEKSEKNVAVYGLREIYINPKYVVCVREDNCMQNKAKNKPLIAGLHSELSYTQIVVHGSGHHTVNITVLGTKDQIATDLTLGEEHIRK